MGSLSRGVAGKKAFPGLGLMALDISLRNMAKLTQVALTSPIHGSTTDSCPPIPAH